MPRPRRIGNHGPDGLRHERQINAAEKYMEGDRSDEQRGQKPKGRGPHHTERHDAPSAIARYPDLAINRTRIPRRRDFGRWRGKTLHQKKSSAVRMWREGRLELDTKPRPRQRFNLLRVTRQRRKEGKMTTEQNDASGPAEGSAIPDFSLATAEGAVVNMSTLRGKPFVLYFYPKADTTGCTKEAQDFSGLTAEFARLSIPVIAVSGDKIASLKKFREKYALTVTLASAEGTTILADFGVWVEKSMYGRKYMGIERATYLADSDGRIVRAWRKVKVPGHAADVLSVAKAL
ncbi:peroxiredoxin [Candidatus Raskinella chloraquaticus]